MSKLPNEAVKCTVCGNGLNVYMDSTTGLAFAQLGCNKCGAEYYGEAGCTPLGDRICFSDYMNAAIVIALDNGPLESTQFGDER